MAHRFGSSRAVVTFSSLNEHERPFGKDFLDSREITGVYFVAKWNHWWQPEGCRWGVEAAQRYLAAIRPETLMTYGASMGGFGAALHSRSLMADTVLMLAPQFTIDPAKPPSETRWRTEASRLKFLHDDLAPQVSLSARKILVYDTLTPDRAHAELFARIPGTELFRTPAAGHAIGHFLLQAGLLQNLVLRALDGSLTGQGYRALVRERRALSGNYWHQLGRSAHVRRRGFTLELYRRAAALRPNDAVILLDYGNALLRERDAGQALEVFQRAAELAPQSAAPYRGLCHAYRAMGMLDEAVGAGEQAMRLRPQTTDLQRVLVTALLAAGRLERALEVITRTVELEPGLAQNIQLRDRVLARLAAGEDVAEAP
ncbi:tetratricopeptide repeat protein [Pararoseomonas baculiformis]|uniref:tetratricopeptide repeat protein n=1 Tax=Pararoseomonas baculiformis TaxID=2820812 RepID=UPI001ADF817D